MGIGASKKRGRAMAMHRFDVLIVTAMLDELVEVLKLGEGGREGWADARDADGYHCSGGVIAGGFWHVIGLCRFEPGELDPYLPSPLRVPDGEPLYQLPSYR
jgi:hypothetical protein